MSCVVCSCSYDYEIDNVDTDYGFILNTPAHLIWRGNYVTVLKRMNIDYIHVLYEGAGANDEVKHILHSLCIVKWEGDVCSVYTAVVFVLF